MSYIGNTNTTQGFTPAIDYFSGNASTTAFTLSRPVASVAQVQAVVNNVAQNPSDAFTVSSNTITFTSAPSSGTNNIYVYYTSPITQVIAPGQGTVGLTQLSATGTPSSSTFLRGDNAWSAPPIPAQIQPISASVAANALTISASALTLNFRSTTLDSGTVTTVSGTPANLVISSGSTLGTVNAVASRIVVIALNNAGTIELAAVNISGGTQLDETNLISTTAEGGSGGADSATVVYSTTARTSLAYRVIGFIQSTQATAGTWATAPSTIQGCGGQALNAMSSLGYGQTWQNVAGSRAVGTTYTNTTGRPIQVQVTSNSGVGNNLAILTINGIIVSSFKDNDYYTASLVTPHNVTNMGIVPPSGTYSITNSNSGTTIQYWAELR
jgi:hypothetical protein